MLHIEEKVPIPGRIKFANILIVEHNPKSDFKFMIFSPAVKTISKGLIFSLKEASIEFFLIFEKENDVKVPIIPINKRVNFIGNKAV